jgi:serine/threonine protein kinase
MMADNWKNDIDLNAVLTKIGEDYQELKYLGEGGFSKVYLVRHKIFDEKRALKIMEANIFLFNLERLEREEGINIKEKYNNRKERFINEARLYKKIKHRNIVKIYDVGVAKDKNRDIEIPYLIMHYIDGVTLKDILKKGSPLEFQTVYRISEDVLSTLAIIHERRVFHRDIKPGNIMIEDESGDSILIDFGLAKDELNETTISGMTFGTPTYMAPEQCKGLKDAGNATDIYSFGVVLYNMVTGEPPFKSESNNPLEIMDAHKNEKVPNVRDKNLDLPAGIENIIFKAMAKKPDDRHRSAEDFLADLKWIKENTEEIEKEDKKDKKKEKEDKPKRNFLKYLLIVFGIIAIAAFFVFDPLGIIKDKGNGIIKPPVDKVELQYREYINTANKHTENGDYEKAIDSLKEARNIKDTEEVHKLSNTITKKQRETMSKNFGFLKAFLIGDASKSKKVAKCREFLIRHQNVPKNNETESMVSDTNKFITQLEAEIRADEKYQTYIESVKKYTDSGDFEKAIDSLNKAKEIKDTEEVKQLSRTIAKKQQEKIEYEKKNGGKDYNSIKYKLNLNKYLEFKRKYPNSIYITALKNRLKRLDKTLPPEKYWNEPIKKNRKGYYELEFGKEYNGHLMIYIPWKNIWIDKYEVSWAQFRKFLRDEKIQFSPIEDDEFIRSGDGFPAVVTYEEAEKYCKKYGLRLPRIDEWEYVAGKGKFTHPWGKESPEVPDAHGNWRANLDTLDGDRDKDGHKGTALVTSYEKFSSPFDAVNMAGNVWEWVQGKILKGGGYLSLYEEDLRIKNIRRAEPYDKEGFRCIKGEK